MIEALGIASLVDGVIAFTLVEAAVLAAYHRSTGKGVALRDFALNMASGLCLMLALRCLVHGAAMPWIALWLLAAGLAHGSDIWLRWRSGKPARAAIEHRRLA